MEFARSLGIIGCREEYQQELFNTFANKEQIGLVLRF